MLKSLQPKDDYEGQNLTMKDCILKKQMKSSIRLLLNSSTSNRPFLLFFKMLHFVCSKSKNFVINFLHDCNLSNKECDTSSGYMTIT